MMQKAGLKMLSLLKSVILELIIICGLLFTINNYIGNSETTINADGIGYFDYLPSIFLRGDFVRYDTPITKDSTKYEHIVKLGPYVEYGDFRVDKYPVGTAFLQSPFFLMTKTFSKIEHFDNPGYQKPFQRSVFQAAIFYLFITLLFLKNLLRLYHLNQITIFAIQVLLVFGTTVTHHVNMDASFSHIYSLMAITGFLFFTKKYFTNNELKQFLFACIFLGLILIIRQINILILISLPFIAGSWSSFLIGFKNLFVNYWKLSLGLLIVFGICSIQFVAWYLQTGHFLVYSYPGEQFNFNDPHIFDILFSYKKGLFIYTPLIFIGLLSSIYFLVKKQYYLFFSWIGFFTILTYVLSSWWSWFYGCSFGLRAYVDFYIILLIPLGILLNNLHKVTAIMLFIISCVTIPINIIQTYQYKNYILHWMDMNKKMYWEVFLKTDEKYEGLIWKREYDFSNFSRSKLWELPQFKIKQGQKIEIFKTELDSDSIDNTRALIQLSFENEFQEKSNSKVSLEITEADGSRQFYYYSVSLIHFREKELGIKHRGLYNYEIENLKENMKYILTFRVEAKEDLDLKEPRVVVFKMKH